jgi:hypothetical protein
LTVDRGAKRRLTGNDDFGVLKAIWHQREREGGREEGRSFRQDKNHSKAISLLQTKEVPKYWEENALCSETQKS